MTTVFAWKREMIRQAIVKHPLANNERIAALTGSSAKTVLAERRAMNANRATTPTTGG